MIKSLQICKQEVFVWVFYLASFKEICLHQVNHSCFFKFKVFYGKYILGLRRFI
jgi:hypothetical protein